MKILRNIKTFLANIISGAKRFIAAFKARLSMSGAILADARGENYVDTGVKILIAVVIGALLLAGLYSLFGDTIMPTVTQKVTDMFNFKG